jgi:hypothetical protein
MVRDIKSAGGVGVWEIEMSVAASCHGFDRNNKTISAGLK